MLKKLSLIIILLIVGLTVFAQDDPTSPALPSLPDLPNADAFDCSPSGMAALYDEMASAYNFDFATDPVGARSALFQLGARYQAIALACNYIPTEEEAQTLVEQTLSVVELADIVAALGIGSDTEIALTEIDALYGDSFDGQLLYNGLKEGLDGNILGCSGCHNGIAAPSVEGTYTRVDEIRLEDDALADYTVRQYLVESILHPEAYLVPEFQNLMPPNFGTRLDAQMLADLVAYLEGQDQLLDE